MQGAAGFKHSVASHSHSACDSNQHRERPAKCASPPQTSNTKQANRNPGGNGTSFVDEVGDTRIHRHFAHMLCDGIIVICKKAE